jgi:hypothetical protein
VNHLPETGTSSGQAVKLVLVVALAALLIGGGVWEAKQTEGYQ